MYMEHDRSTVVDLSNRDHAPDIPIRRRSVEDFLAGGQDTVHRPQFRKERKVEIYNNGNPATAALASLQTWNIENDSSGDAMRPSTLRRSIRRSSILGSSRRCVSSQSRQKRRPTRSLGSQGAPTLPTITEFCSTEQVKSSAQCGDTLNVLTWPRRRQSLRSYSNLLKALSIDSTKDYQNDQCSRNATFGRSSEETTSRLQPKLHATILEALSNAESTISGN
jgi:hypothetical protein